MEKIKETVNLRQRKMKNGGYSLYLDWFFHGKREREFLGLYLGKNKAENQSTMQIATLRKIAKIEQLQEMESGISLKKYEGAKYELKDYALKCVERHDNKHTRQDMMSLVRLIPDTGYRLASIDRSRFIDLYRLVTKDVANNTKIVRYTWIKSFLNQAKKDGLIRDVPDLSGIAPKREEGKREFLTFDELQRFASVDIPGSEAYRDTFLFSCFTGLRHSDVNNLKWSDIDGDVIVIKQIKTNDLVRIPLSPNAKAVMPPQRDGERFVFQKRTGQSFAKWLPRICKAAGIDKNITFHCARHTFATLSLTFGAEFYTISKVLGHASTKTTEIYVKLLDEAKRKAVDSIPRI